MAPHVDLVESGLRPGFSPSALDVLPAPVFEVQADGRILVANAAFLRLFGVGSLPDGCGIATFLGPASRVAQAMAEARRRGTCAVELEDLSGRGRRSLHCTFTPSRSAGRDSCVALLRVAHVPTALAADPGREGEWSRAVVAAADASRLGLAINVARPGGAVLAFVNDAGARLLGAARSGLMGGPAFPRLEGDVELALRRAMSDGPDAGVEIQHRRPDGSAVRLDVGLSCGDYWGEPAVFAFYRDVSRERALEAEARAAQQRVVRGLEEAARFKADLLNLAAHELGTPITPIAIQLRLLRDALDSGRPPGRALEILERNFDRLSRLAADLLQVARMHGDLVPLERRTMDLGALAQDACDTFADVAAAKSVALRCDGPGTPAHLDPDRILQVLANLIANAIRFTPPGGEVRVGVRSDGADAIVEVTDTGPGLDPAQKALLFQPFGQAHPGHGGTGLGLYISKGLVERHGGRIWAESAGPSLGSVFGFAVPRAAHAAGDGRGTGSGHGSG